MSDTESLKEEEKKIRSLKKKLVAEKALPQSSAETLVKIIKGYAVASNGGNTSVNYKDVASISGISSFGVSGNNRFLEESGILSSPRYGYYVPTEGAVRFARESAWDEPKAKSHLRRIIANCWFGQVATQNLTLRSNVDKNDLKKSLAIKCGASEGDSNALSFLIDFILYTGLLEADENSTLIRGNFDEVEDLHTETINSADNLILPNGLGMVRDEPYRAKDKNISVVIHLHINCFDELTPDHATRLKNWIKSLEGMADVQSHIEIENPQQKLE